MGPYWSRRLGDSEWHREVNQILSRSCKTHADLCDRVNIDWKAIQRFPRHLVQIFEQVTPLRVVLYPPSHRRKQRMVLLSERGHWIIQVELTPPTKLEFQASDGEKSNENEILNWKSNLIFLWNHNWGLCLVNIAALHKGPINRISWSGSLTKRAFIARYCVSLTLINTCAFTCRV